MMQVLNVVETSVFEPSEISVWSYPIKEETKDKNVQDAEYKYIELIEIYIGRELTEEEKDFYLAEGFFEGDRGNIILTWGVN